MSTVKLLANDVDLPIKVDLKVAFCSQTIKYMFEQLDDLEDDEEVIPVPEVSDAILKLVLKWAEHHKDDPTPPKDYKNNEKRSDDINSWDTDFVKQLDLDTFVLLMKAANYLDIKGLQEVCCKTVANMIKGKNSAEIRKIFNIWNDLEDQVPEGDEVREDDRVLEGDEVREEDKVPLDENQVPLKRKLSQRAKQNIKNRKK